MPRQKKDAKTLNIKLATPIANELDKFCDESGMTKTMAVERILSQFFQLYFRRPVKQRITL